MHVLHHDVDEITDLAESIHGYDARMAEPRRQPSFATKTLAVLFRRRELVAENLDGDQPVQRDVARQEDDTHPAASELAHDLELGAEKISDLITLPVPRRCERCRRGHLERICVGIDE